jgi:hypothetical protein
VLLTPLLHPWYLLWLVALLVPFVQPDGKYGLRFDAWTGWLLFTGTVAMSYTFYIEHKVVIWTVLVEFVPLYALLILPRFLRRKPV